jgi:hypothetical protein
MEMANSHARFMNPLSKMIAAENKLRNQFIGFEMPSAFKAILERQALVDRFSLGIAKSYSVFDRLKTLTDAFRSNPEIEFISVSDLEILSVTSTSELVDSLEEDHSDNFITLKEELLEEFLLPYLGRLELDYLWAGANHALDATENPDRFRQALVSLRTLLEALIERELACNLELSTSPLFTKEFKNFHLGKEELHRVRIKRSKRIKYFTSKVQFGILEEFTEKDIDFVCQCYENLCRIHNPNLQLTETQVRILKIKTGVTLWLLAHINELIKNGNS